MRDRRQEAEIHLVLEETRKQSWEQSLTQRIDVDAAGAGIKAGDHRRRITTIWRVPGPDAPRPSGVPDSPHPAHDGASYV